MAMKMKINQAVTKMARRPNIGIQFPNDII